MQRSLAAVARCWWCLALLALPVHAQLGGGTIFFGSCLASCTCSSTYGTPCTLADGVTNSTCGAFGVNYSGSPQCNPVCGDLYCATSETYCKCPGDCPNAPLACFVGDVSGTPNSADNNVCIADVVAAVQALPDHGARLAFWLDDQPPATYPLPAFNHWQGVQRLGGQRSQHLVTSRSFSGSGPAPVFSIARLASRSDSGGPLGSNVAPSLPHAGDAVVSTSWGPRVPPTFYPQFRHAGGIQVLGTLLAVPYQEGGNSEIVFYDVSNPAHPLPLSVLDTTPNAAGHAGAVGVVKLADGRFLALLVNDTQVNAYVSSTTGIDGATSWAHMGVWCAPSSNPIAGVSPQCVASANDPTGQAWQSYQNFQLVTQCDGKIFAIGTYNTWPVPPGGSDFVAVWRLDNLNVNRVGLTRLALEHMYCDQWCSFAAGGGAYVTPDRRLVLYGVVHAGQLEGMIPWVQLTEYSY